MATIAHAKDTLSQHVEAVLDSLTPIEQKVLRMRFGIGVASAHPLEEVARDFGEAHEKIREIEQRALRRLRFPKRFRPAPKAVL